MLNSKKIIFAQVVGGLSVRVKRGRLADKLIYLVCRPAHLAISELYVWIQTSKFGYRYYRAKA